MNHHMNKNTFTPGDMVQPGRTRDRGDDRGTLFQIEQTSFRIQWSVWHSFLFGYLFTEIIPGKAGKIPAVCGTADSYVI